MLSSQPTWVHGGALYPHQLEAVNWLRRLWAEGRPALLADGGGLGKTASIITFLQSLRYHIVRPRTFCTIYTIQMDALLRDRVGDVVIDDSEAERIEPVGGASKTWAISKIPCIQVDVQPYP